MALALADTLVFLGGIFTALVVAVAYELISAWLDRRKYKL